MAVSRLAATFAIRITARPSLFGIACLAAAVPFAIVQAQAQQPQDPLEKRVVVIGEGSVSVPPDYARIRSGVTTRAKTVKEAVDANSKLMTAVTAALLDAGIAQKDIQTSRLSLQPVYAPQQPNTEPKLSGYSVTNQVSVAIRQVAKIGEILDRLVAAGATDVGNLEFLHSDPSKALDQAREAAVADARHKAELYAHAAGLTLGRIAWITEDPGYAPSMPMAAMRANTALAVPVPIAAGEDTFLARITAGFDISP